MRLILSGLFTFYVQTWDEYHTKTLTLGLISGPVEGITTLYIVYGITAFVGGGSFWQQSLLQTLGVPPSKYIPDQVYKLTWTENWMAYGALVLVFNTWQRYVLPFPSSNRTSALPTNRLHSLTHPSQLLLASLIHS